MTFTPHEADAPLTNAEPHVVYVFGDALPEKPHDHTVYVLKDKSEVWRFEAGAWAQLKN